MTRARSRHRMGLALLLAACGGDGGVLPDGASVLPGVPSVVFVKRAYLRADGTHDVTGGMGQVFDYDRYVPGDGAGVFVLTPPAPGGVLRNLTAGLPGIDVNGLDLSFDAKRVVFSARTADERRYHLYVADLDGASPVKQLTFGEADDTQPVFLAGGRIAFVTNQPFTEMGTRADEYNHARRVTQMATISEIAGDADRRLCAQNLSHHAAPFALADGLVGFSRWEHLGPVNDVKLFTMRPDCTQMRALAGQHDKPFNSLVQVRERSRGELLGIATSRDGTVQAGALMQVSVPTGGDPQSYDEQGARFVTLTPRVPTGDEAAPDDEGRYRAPTPLPGSSKVLVSWARGSVNEREELSATAPDFGLHLFDPATGARALVYDDPKLWDLYALPVLARAEPPVLSAVNDGVYDLSKSAQIGSIDVRSTSLNERVDGAQFDGTALVSALGEAQRVRVIEGFSSEIGSVGQFGLTMHEGAAILGEAPVYTDGSWLAEIPPYLPVHLQPIDRFDLAIRNQLLWIQANPGESRVCGGCHERRTGTVLSATTLAQQRGATRMLAPIPERIELPWADARTGPEVQDVFDAKCIACHAGGETDPFAGRSYQVTVLREDGSAGEQYTIPILDLSSRVLETYYERTAVSYPASYVTLLFPSAMMGTLRVEGAPVEWVVPGNARASRFIAKLNVNAVVMAGDGSLSETDEWAFTSRPHPEDVGVALTRAERQTLIRAIDLGAQYHSHRNVGGGGTAGMEYQP